MEGENLNKTAKKYKETNLTLDELKNFEEELKIRENELNQREIEIKKQEDIIKEFDGIINELREQLKSRDQTIIEITHDTRAPLSAVCKLIELTINELESGEFNLENFKSDLIDINISVDNVVGLLEDVLIWHRIRLNKINPDIIEMELKDPIDKQISRLSSVASLKGIKIINEIDENFMVKADINVLDTIIKNLISNSIKFTKNNGEIVISSKYEDDLSLIIITDNGVGIKEEILKDLFKKSGITNLGTSGEKGTGLGLQNCKDMIEKIAGTIEIKSEGHNKGTTVILRLPSGK